MKKALKLLSAAAIGAFFLLPVQAFATESILYYVLDGATDSGSNDTTIVPLQFNNTYTCATLPAWEVTKIVVPLRATFDTLDFVAQIRVASTTGSSVLVAQSDTQTVGTSGSFSNYTFTFTSPVDLRAGCTAKFTGTPHATSFVSFELVKTSGVGGARSVIGGVQVLPGTSSRGNSGTFGSMMNSTVWGETSVTGETRILQQTSPASGTVTPSTQVTFAYSYYFNDVQSFGVLDRACVDIMNATVSQTVTPICVAIGAAGTNNFSQTAFLSPGYNYTWRPYLTSSTTAQGRIYGEFVWFSVVEAPVTQSLLPPTEATSTPALQAWFSGAQNAILGVPPWSYWVQLRTIMDESKSLLTGTSTLPTMEFAVGATTTPIHFNISVFTAESVSRLIPKSFFDAGKVLIASAMYVLFALMIYHEANRRWSKNHS